MKRFCSIIVGVTTIGTLKFSPKESNYKTISNIKKFFILWRICDIDWHNNITTHQHCLGKLWIYSWFTYPRIRRQGELPTRNALLFGHVVDLFADENQDWLHGSPQHKWRGFRTYSAQLQNIIDLKRIIFSFTPHNNNSLFIRVRWGNDGSKTVLRVLRFPYFILKTWWLLG